MLAKHIFLAAMGVAGGLAVAAGTFAFIIVIGVVPRMIGKSNTANQIVRYENAIVLGGIIGNIISVYLNLRIPLGRWILTVFGLCSGIHVGCMAVALAEILNTFPIMFRRMRLKNGLEWAIFFMAIGKVVGSFWYFLHNMGAGV